MRLLPEHSRESEAMDGLTAVIFNIQRYCIHDGPGIRTVIFFKGCPLRCAWCANPESQESDPQILYTEKKCIQCGSCAKAAPAGYIQRTRGENTVNWDTIRKDGRFAWISECPTGAMEVKGREITVPELLEEVERDRCFYRHNGGVTLSGGEALMQPDFVKAFLKACKGRSINTAIETAGYVQPEILKEVIPFTDIFLYDFKFYDNDMHRKWTGLGNRRIKENLEFLLQEGARVEVRIPLIPGINDGKDELEKIAAYLKKYGIGNWELLPFHQHGSGKYAACGIPYGLKELKSYDRKKLEEVKLWFQETYNKIQVLST